MAIEFVDLLDSANQKYDNSTSGLVADNAKDAIDELAADLAGFSGDMAISTQVDQLTVTAVVETLYVVTTGATNGTCTVNLPTPTSAGARLGVIFHAENTDTDKVVISPAASDEIDGSTADIELTAPGEYLYLRADGDGTNWYTYSSTSSGTAGTAAGVGSGSLQFIEKKTYSGATEATIDLTGYSAFQIRIVNWVPGTDATDMNLQVSDDGGTTWESGATDYKWVGHYHSSTGTSGGIESAGDTEITLINNLGTGTGEVCSLSLTLEDRANGDIKQFTISGGRKNSSGNYLNHHGSGFFEGNTNDIDALRIYPSSGTFSGSIVVYGIAEDHERFGVSSQFSGAMVKNASDKTTQDYSSGVVITWDTEDYDVGGWADLGTNNTRVTVTSGVNRARVTAHIQLAAVDVATANFQVSILKNGVGLVYEDRTTAGYGVSMATIVTPVIDVVEGDYFEVKVWCSDTSTTLKTGSALSIEAVGLVGTTIDKARAYLGTGYSSAVSTWEKLDLDTTSYDTGGIWDVTNERFIPTKAGYYLFTGHSGTTTTGEIGAAIYKNGTEAERLGLSTSGYSQSGSAIVYCNGTTDYVELWAFTNTSRTYSQTSSLAVFGPILGTSQGSTDYLMSGFYPGAPTASAKMMVHAFAAGVTVDVAMAGSQGTAETAATAQTDFDVQKNGVSAGTMRFAAAATTATFIMATATSFSPGDKLQLIAPATPDATLADIAWSFKGTKG